MQPLWTPRLSRQLRVRSRFRHPRTCEPANHKKEETMPTRREFVTAMAVAAAGAAGERLAWAQGPAKRREIFIGKKRVKVIDSHAHLNSPEVASVVKGTPYERQAGAAADEIIGPDRIAIM